MRSDHYVWLVWASAFPVPWIVLFALCPAQRRVTWRASVSTMLLFAGGFGMYLSSVYEHFTWRRLGEQLTTIF